MGTARALERRDTEMDALRTERNAALDEAKMWLRRMLTMQRERDQARADLYATDKCLGEWQAAYDDLLRAFRRLEVAYGHEKDIVDYYESLTKHLDPFLPAWLQSPDLRAGKELLYEQLAPYRADDAGPRG